MENNITETVMKNRRYNELFMQLSTSLPAADERLRSCVSDTLFEPDTCSLDPKSYLDAFSELDSEVKRIQHEVSEFVACSKDLIAILSVLDCHDSPKALEIQRCMVEIQQQSDKTSLAVEDKRSKLHGKIEKLQTAEQGIGEMVTMLQCSVISLDLIVKTKFADSSLEERVCEQKKFHSSVCEKCDRASALIAHCKQLGVSSTHYEELCKLSGDLLSSSQKYLQQIEQMHDKVKSLNDDALHLKVWLLELLDVLNSEVVLCETISERQSRADNICNQRRTKRKVLDDLSQALHQLYSNGFILKDGFLSCVIASAEDSWSQISHLFGKFVSSLVFAELELIMPILDQCSTETTRSDSHVIEFDIHWLSLELQNQKVVSCNAEDTFQRITGVVERYRSILCEAYEDMSSCDFIDVNNHLTDVQNRSQQVCLKANKRLSYLNEIWPIVCLIKKRQTQIETVLFEIEAELKLLGDSPNVVDLEHLQIYRQSVQAIDKMLGDYQPIVDDMVITTNEFLVIDSPGEKLLIQSGVQSTVAKFETIKKAVLSCHVKMDALCSTAVEDRVNVFLSTTEHLKAQLVFADPIINNSVGIKTQLVENDNLIDQLKSVASDIDVINAMLCKLETMDSAPDGNADGSVLKEVKEKFEMAMEIKNQVETSAQQRSEQLQSALVVAEASENGLRTALDTLNVIKDYALSLTVNCFNSVSLKKYVVSLKEKIDELVKLRHSLGDWYCSELSLTAIDMLEPAAMQRYHQVTFDIHYEEVMDVLNEKICEPESLLASVQEFENLFQTICTWISLAEQRVSGLTAIADSIRTVRIQIEELKVFTLQMRTWRSQLDQWNQVFMTICRFGTSSENGSLDLLKADVANINGRWTKLCAALECRKVDLMTAYAKLGEVDMALDDINGLIQEAESDLLQSRQVYGDPQCITLELAKVEKMFKEVANQRVLLGVLSNTVKSVQPIANSNDVSHSTAFDKKLSDTEELLTELEMIASETRTILRNHLHQVQDLIHCASGLTRWFIEQRRLILARNVIPFGALVDTAHRQLDDTMIILSTAAGKSLEVEAIISRGEDLLSLCQKSNAYTILGTLERLRGITRDFHTKTNNYKIRLQTHVRNVELFHRLMQGQVDWLSDAETRLFMLRRPSRLVSKIQDQLKTHQTLMDEIALHRESMKHIDLTGTYLKYLGTRYDFNQLGELLMMLRLRWKRLVRHANETRQHLLHAFYEDKRFADSWTSLCEWLKDTALRLQYQSVCTTSSCDFEDIKLSKHVEVEFVNRLPSYLSTRRSGMTLYEQCPSVGESSTERQTLMDMLVTLKKSWNAIPALITQSGCQDISKLLLSGHSSIAADALTSWICRAKVYLSKDQPILGDLDTVAHLIDQHKSFQNEAAMKRELVEKMLKLSQNEISPNEKLKTVTSDWEAMIRLELERWNDLKQAIRLANSFNESIDAVLEWLPRAEEEMGFCPIATNEEAILPLIESHKRFDEELRGQSIFVDELMRIGSEIMASCHSSAKRTVCYHMTSISARWLQVLRRSSYRDQRLKEALDLARSNVAMIDSMYRWLQDIQHQLKSKENSVIPQSITALKQETKQHKTFHEVLSARRSDLERVKQLVQPVLDAPQPESVQKNSSKASEVVELWKSVWRMSCSRARHLEDALQKCNVINTKKQKKVAEKMTSDASKIAQKNQSDVDKSIKVVATSRRELLAALRLNLKDPNKSCVNSSAGSGSSPRMNSSKQKEISFAPSSPMNRRKQNIDKSSSVGDFDASPRGTGKPTAGEDPKWNSKQSTNDVVLNHVPSKSAHAVLSPRSEGVLCNAALLTVPRESNTPKDCNGSLGRKEIVRSPVSGCSESLACSKDNCSVVSGERLNVEMSSPVVTDNDHVRCEKNCTLEGSSLANEGGENLSNSCYLPSTNLTARNLIQESRQCGCRSEKPAVSAEVLVEQIQEELMRCQCPGGFPFTNIEDGKYKFGARGRICLIRFVNSTVTVRVGGGWLRLDEFLDAVDPCRIRHRRRLLPSSPDDVFDAEVRNNKLTSPASNQTPRTTSPMRVRSAKNSSASSRPTGRSHAPTSCDSRSDRGRELVRTPARKGVPGETPHESRSRSVAITSRDKKPEAQNQRVPRSASQSGIRIVVQVS